MCLILQSFDKKVVRRSRRLTKPFQERRNVKRHNKMSNVANKEGGKKGRDFYAMLGVEKTANQVN